MLRIASLLLFITFIVAFRFYPSRPKNEFNWILKAPYQPQMRYKQSSFVRLRAGVDAETLGSLDNLQSIGDSVDLNPGEIAVDIGAPLSSILTKFVSSPIVLAAPIGAGLLIAGLFGIFIYSYGKGSD
jgi:hypothetical protein